MKTIAERLAERRTLKRRIKRLEKCLADVTRLARLEGYELNSAGNDTAECPEWVFICKVLGRIQRTTRKQP